VSLYSRRFAIGAVEYGTAVLYTFPPTIEIGILKGVTLSLTPGGRGGIYLSSDPDTPWVAFYDNTAGASTAVIQLATWQVFNPNDVLSISETTVGQTLTVITSGYLFQS
jgi:hypothetical protein